MDRCNSCDAAIRWVLTPKGKRMPLDPEPSPAGNVLVEDGVGLTLGGDLLIAALHEERDLYTSHFATCPNAARHRGRPRT